MFVLLFILLNFPLSGLLKPEAKEIFEKFDVISSVHASTQCSGMAPGLLGLAIKPDGKTAYIPFSLDDAVLVIDLQNFSIKGCIDVSSAGSLLLSTAARITPDGRYVLIANYGAGNIMVIDTSSNTVTEILPIEPKWGDCLHISNDGNKAYVAGLDRRLHIININNFSYTEIPNIFVDTAIPSKLNPDIVYCIVFDEESDIFFKYQLSTSNTLNSYVLPDEALPYRGISRFALDSPEAFAYFGQGDLYDDRGHGNLCAFDLQQFELVSCTAMENGVWDFVVNAANNMIYAVGMWSGGTAPGILNIIEWDTITRTIARYIPVDPLTDPRALSLDPLSSNHLYLTKSDANTLVKINITSGDEVQSLAFHQEGKFNPNFIIPTESNIAYVTCQNSPTVFKLDLSLGKITGTLNLPAGMKGAQGVGYHQGYLYFVHDNEIYKVHPSNGSVVTKYDPGIDINCYELTFFDDKMSTIDFYPGGHIPRKMLLFNANSFQIINSHDFPMDSVTHAGKVNVSPDGLKLYTSGGLGSGPNTVTIYNSSNLDVENTIVIPDQGSGSGGPGYFDNDNRLFYLVGFKSVFVIDMDTDQLVNILDTGDILTLINQPNSHPGTALAGISISPNKDMLFIISSDTHRLYTYYLPESRWMPEILNLIGYQSNELAHSLDLKYLYSANFLSGNITMVNATTRTVKKIIDLENWQNKGQWVPAIQMLLLMSEN